jgi:putative transcriptional regulator
MMEAAYMEDFQMNDEMNGSDIRDLRKRLGLTQEEFAHAVAVTFSTANRWENGHAKPSKLARRAIEALASRAPEAPAQSQTIDQLAGQTILGNRDQ